MFVAKHKLQFSIFAIAVLACTVFAQIFLLGNALAQQVVTCPDGFSTPAPFGEREAICQDHQTGTATRDSEEGGGPPQDNGNLEADCNSVNVNKENCGIVAYIVTIINVLSGLVGIVVVIMITVGGIQYSTARDNPQAAAAAKQRIANAVMALVFFLFTYAFLQWIVPGGVL